VKRPVRNAAAFVLGDAGSRLIGFVITVYLARVLSPEGFGLVNIGLAILGHMGIVASPGISLLETRNAAAVAGNLPERAGGILVLRMIIAALLCTITWSIVLAFPSIGLAGYITLLYVASLLPMAVSLDWFFTGKEQIAIVSGSRLLHYLVYGLVVFLTVKSFRDVPFAAAAFLAGSWAASVFLLLIYGARFGKLGMHWQPGYWWKILKENLPVGSGMFLGQLVVNLPPIVLGLIAGTAAVGRFSAASKIAFLFLLIDRLFNTLFLPIISRHLSRRNTEVGKLFRVVLKGTTVIMVVVGIAGVLFAPWLTQVVYGQAYENSFPLLEVLMGYVFLTVVNSVFVCTILGAGRTREYLRVTAIGGAVLAFAVVVCTLLLGEWGTTIGVVVGEAAAVGLSMFEARRIIPGPAAGTLASVCIGAVGILALPTVRFAVGPVLSVVAGGLISVAVLLALGGIKGAEIRYLRERLV
jgi:O-antigen/teichoic acid export membrane protein